MNSCFHGFLPEKKDSVSCPVKGKAAYENADVFIVLITVDLRANSLHGNRLGICRRGVRYTISSGITLHANNKIHMGTKL